MRQKGFTSECRCKINIELLNFALSYCKRNNGGLFTIVDISKAFDTVPHAALKPCLARKAVPAWQLVVDQVLVTGRYQLTPYV